MNRYNSHNGSGTGGSNNNDDFDDISLKLQEYSAVRLTPTGLNFSSHPQYGDSMIANFEDGVVLDGVVMARDDKPGTWKVFSPGMFYDVDDETGAVMNDGEEMSAQDVLESPRVQGFSESFGGTTYFYTPVGVVLEPSGDVAMNDDYADAETDDPGIEMGNVSMFCGNKSWCRTYAKLVTETAGDVIATDEEGMSIREDAGWMTTDDPTLRSGLDGRSVELFIIEESFTPDDSDEEIEYTTPVLLDSSTGARITIDNDESDTDEAEPEPAVADGGSTTQEDTDDTTDTELPETPETAGEGYLDGADETDESDDGGRGGNVPDELDQLLNYFAKTDGAADPEELRRFAEDQIEADPDDVDWEAAAAEVENRA